MRPDYDKKLEAAYTEVVNALFVGKTHGLVGVKDIDVVVSAPADEPPLRHLTITAQVSLIDDGEGWSHPPLPDPPEPPPNKTTTGGPA